VIWLWACAAPLPLPEAQPTVATQVQAGAQLGPTQWGAVATAIELSATGAQAADVTVVQAPAGQPPLSIQAQRSDWNLKDRSVLFEGAVRAQRGNMTLTCSRLTAIYGESRQVQELRAEGEVVVVQGERRVTAALATLQGGTLLLTGQPKLEEGTNSLLGQKITFFLDQEKVQCEGAEGSPCELVLSGGLGARDRVEH
jgi:lipopolysaccharide export system protein LptA